MEGAAPTAPGSQPGRPGPPVPEPMLARLARSLPAGPDWWFEPKWDGFRALAVRDGDDVELWSRHQRPLARYFPELVAALRQVGERSFVVDGEIVIPGPDGLGFSTLMLRLHPAGSRVERMAREHPATFVAFDLLAVGGGDVLRSPFAQRRAALAGLLDGAPPPVVLTPASDDRAVAERWLEQLQGGGIDGVVAKHAASTYEPGRRAMTKVKQLKTADCVVAGYREVVGGPPRVASLLLGLHDGDGALRHVGVCSTFTADRRRQLHAELAPHVTTLAGHPWAAGFGIEGRPIGRLKGAAGVWTPDRPPDWVPVRPDLVAEVAFDQVDGDRFRHPARFVRWRPDRTPASCTFDQLVPRIGSTGGARGPAA